MRTVRSPPTASANYARASIVGRDRVLLDFGGNRYRLVVRFDYTHRVAFVRFIGTHAEYDRIDASTV